MTYSNTTYTDADNTMGISVILEMVTVIYRISSASLRAFYGLSFYMVIGVIRQRSENYWFDEEQVAIHWINQQWQYPESCIRKALKPKKKQPWQENIQDEYCVGLYRTSYIQIVLMYCKTCLRLDWCSPNLPDGGAGKSNIGRDLIKCTARANSQILGDFVPGC